MLKLPCKAYRTCLIPAVAHIIYEYMLKLPRKAYRTCLMPAVAHIIYEYMLKLPRKAYRTSLMPAVAHIIYEYMLKLPRKAYRTSLMPAVAPRKSGVAFLRLFGMAFSFLLFSIHFSTAFPALLGSVKLFKLPTIGRGRKNM